MSMVTYLLIAYNLIRFCLLKICHVSSNFSFIQRISPFCRFRIYQQGRVILGYNTQIENGSDLQVHGNGILQIGSRCYMNRYCMVSVQESVSIGENCMFGPGVKIFDNNHCFSAQNGVSGQLKTAPIHIGRNCWLASDVIVLKGSVIGDNCVIGAGCIISGNIPKGSLVKQDRKLQITKIR